jgi:plasmid stability protein
VRKKHPVFTSQPRLCRRDPRFRDFRFWKLEAGCRVIIARDRLAIIAINAIIDDMASITIRKLPENTKRRLRIRAARNGRSMEQEAREILEGVLQQPEPPQENLAEAIRRIFAPLGGVELQIPKREPIPEDRIRKLFR